MPAVLIFKALHILSMITMVSVFLGGEFFYTVAYLRHDVRALAFVHRTEVQTRVPILGLAALFLGVVFGLLTAATGGLDFFRGWLIAAYLLVAAFLVNSALLAERLLRLARKAVEADAGKRATEEVVHDMAASRAVWAFFPVNIAIFAAIILDMVLKPF
jgi:Predicted integral membrane protein (DUF2269).